MVEVLIDKPNEQTEHTSADITEEDIVRISAAHGFYEARTEIPLSMKVAAGAGLVATAAGLALARGMNK